MNAFRDAFPNQVTRANDGSLSYQDSMKDFPTTITSNITGLYGGVCSIQREILADTALDPLPPFPSDGPWFRDSSIDPLPMPKDEDVLFLTHYVIRGNDTIDVLHHVHAKVIFEGMFIYSPGLSVFIAPPDDKRYPIVGSSGEEVGEVRLSGVKRHPEMRDTRFFSLNGQIVEFKNPHMFRKKETLGGRIYRILKELYVDGEEVGKIYEVSKGNGSLFYSRLFAFVNDTYVNVLGVLFAFYHIKQYGNAILAQQMQINSH